jgi:RimJ/RimL family protein N-acetyltransferase
VVVFWGGATVVGVKMLVTERLLLEPWDERHRGVWRLHCRDPEVRRFIGSGQVLGTEQADADFDWMLAHWREHGFGWRSVLDSATGEWLGFVGLSFVPPELEGIAAAQVEIGWSLVRSAWGRGIATEGAMSARDDGFERLGLERLMARRQPANLASARVAEKIGMSFERKATGRQDKTLHIYVLERSSWAGAASRP